MDRKDLLKSKEYWIVQIQTKLFQVIKDYMEKKNFNRVQLASDLKVTKGYISQVLNGDFDHKLSKLVDLALSCNAVPLVHFVDLETYIKDDLQNKLYDLMSMQKPMEMDYKMPKETAEKQNKTVASIPWNPIGKTSTASGTPFTIK